MSAARYVPERGDILWLTFDPGPSRTIRTAPALVLSPSAYNRRASLALVCPTTNQAKGYPFEVALSKDSPVSSVVLADHVKSADWAAHRAQFAGKVPSGVLADVTAKLRPRVGL